MINPLTYVKESKAELEKVVWPTPNQTVRLTIIVVVVSVIIGAYIAGLDALFTNITAKIIK